MYNFIWSIGLSNDKQGQIKDVLWNGHAFKAGISTGAKVVAVNGRDYSREVLTNAIAAAGNSKSPIELSLSYQGGNETVRVEYYDGLQYPHLERIEGTPDYLSQIIAMKK